MEGVRRDFRNRLSAGRGGVHFLPVAWMPRGDQQRLALRLVSLPAGDRGRRVNQERNGWHRTEKGT